MLNLLNYYPSYYTAKNLPGIIQIEKSNFISIVGKGSFTEKIFYHRIGALRQATQNVVDLFQDSKQAFSMSVLEGLYWNDEKYGQHSISQVFDAAPLSELNYRLMIRLPEYVTSQDVATAKAARDAGHKNSFDGIEFFEYNEGKCVQMLHKGPFIYEIETLKMIEQFADENSLKKNGLHHEIYLVDFAGGGSQEKLKTILREPVDQ
jgi:hypothetical protein